jgi:hypothetical protein
MESANHLERDEGWGVAGAEWERIERLLALARTAPEEPLSPERRQQILDRVLERCAKIEIRRRRSRFFLVGAAVLLLGRLVTTFVRARRLSHA